MTAPLANLNGVQMPLADVKVSALDRGFLFGDGIYEVLQVIGGKQWLEEEHYARLGRSLDAIRINGVDLARLRRRCGETLAASGMRDALLYIQVTRGAAPRSHAFPDGATPTELVWVQPYKDSFGEGREKGVGVVTFADIRWGRCDIKSVNLLGNVLAMQAAKEAGCQEAVLVKPDGTVTEASHSSFFGVRGGAIWATPDGPAILPGCTRDFVLRLAATHKIPVRYESLKRDELTSADECFLTGTTAEVLPVVRVDGRPVADGRPGPVTRKLQHVYREAVAAWLAGS